MNVATRSDKARLVFTAYKWIVVAPLLAFSTIILGTIIMVFSVLGAPNFASRVFATTWARLNAGVSMVTVNTKGLENLDKTRSYVIVANHQSLIDIYVLYGFLGVDIKWVMKRELRAVPVLGLACELMGHILVDRSNTDAALESINSARSRVIDGISVVFFPEGTRSRSGELREFKKGAFRFAQEMGLPLLPVVIHGTKDILPSDTMELTPGETTLEILPAIETAGLTPEDMTRITLQVREQIGNALIEGI